MVLRLIELVRPPRERFWQPFSDHDGFMLDWWRQGYDGHSYRRVLDGDTEVSRVDLDNNVSFDEYCDVPVAEGEALEI